MSKSRKMRTEYSGLQIVQVKSIPVDSSPQKWAYAWGGLRDLEIGDQLVLIVDGRDWEVEIVAFGTEYEGQLTVIGGEYGLAYTIGRGRWEI